MKAIDKAIRMCDESSVLKFKAKNDFESTNLSNALKSYINNFYFVNVVSVTWDKAKNTYTANCNYKNGYKNELMVVIENYPVFEEWV